MVRSCHDGHSRPYHTVPWQGNQTVNRYCDSAFVCVFLLLFLLLLFFVVVFSFICLIAVLSPRKNGKIMS